MSKISQYSNMELLKIKPKKAAKKVVKKKKKLRNVKYSITLSDAENKQLTKVCKKDSTTSGRLIKSVLREYLKNRSSKINEEIAENQLNLFKNPKPVQYKIDG
ncbi:MAG: hypothetical protein LBH22_03830 [Bacteroidales bacterium]|nr:hypothetical protein [Bacteroidales bacterium]